MPASMERLNTLPADELVTELMTCLHVRRWAEEIAGRRPFADLDALYAAADEAGDPLSEPEIHSALSAHPRIGERSDSAMSQREQSGVDQSDDGLLAALWEGNEEYEHRFGHVYLVCASGRSGAELLEILRSRLTNDPETEMAIVADELRKIARLRLAKVAQA